MKGTGDEPAARQSVTTRAPNKSEFFVPAKRQYRTERDSMDNDGVSEIPQSAVGHRGGVESFGASTE
jgi:hypothetical protein